MGQIEGEVINLPTNTYIDAVDMLLNQIADGKVDNLDGFVTTIKRTSSDGSPQDEMIKTLSTDADIAATATGCSLTILEDPHNGDALLSVQGSPGAMHRYLQLVQHLESVRRR